MSGVLRQGTRPLRVTRPRSTSSAEGVMLLTGGPPMQGDQGGVLETLSRAPGWVTSIAAVRGTARDHLAATPMHGRWLLSQRRFPPGSV